MTKFSYAVFNPPYQQTVGGTKNIDVWPLFIDAANEIAGSSCIINPGRWVIPKKQMKPVHDKIINSGLVGFDYYENSNDLFQNVAIDGGVTIGVFKQGYHNSIKYFNHGAIQGNYQLDHTFFSNIYEKEAYEKTIRAREASGTIADRVLGNIGSLGGGEFGYKKHEMIHLLTDDKDSLQHPIPVWANAGFGRGTRFAWHYIEKEALRNVPDRLFSSRKVMLDKKGNSIGSSGCGNIINNIPQIVDKDATASGDVFFVFPEHDTEYDLNLIRSYFMTKTVRFLLSITQKDLYVRGFENVPDYTCFMDKLHGQLFTDDFLYEEFNFSQELITYIESHISAKKDNV